MQAQPLLIRADASTSLGTGHVMRSIALAQAWQNRGGSTHLASIRLPDPLRDRLHEEGIETHTINADIQAGSKPDALLTVKIAREMRANWVVADGYQFHREFQDSIKTAGLRLGVITDYDYCNRWNCDLILNQNPHASDEAYTGDGAVPQRLLGTRYALLREEFLEAARIPASPGDRPRLLITLGGSDSENLTGRLLKVLENPDVSSDHLDLRILTGAANPHRKSLEALATNSRHRVDVRSQVSDMHAQFRWADGIIGAGGSSCWEVIHARLPAAIIVIADNQQPIYDHLTDAGVALGLGRADQWDTAIVSSQLAKFVRQLSDPRKLSTCFPNWIDGHGAARVAAALDSNIWLRRAEQSDCERYYEWANDPVVRKQSLSTDRIEWDSHSHWFSQQLTSPDSRLFVAIRNDQLVGQVRFNRSQGNEWTVSFSVAEEARGSGIGKQLLSLGAQHIRRELDATLLAIVRIENAASANCFRKLGWQPVQGVQKDLLRFRLSA